MMVEEDLVLDSRRFDVSDINNEPDIYDIEKDSEFRIHDMLLPPQIKIVFILFCVIMLVFSLMYYGVLPALFFLLIMGFIMDLMGMFDSIEEMMKRGRKPRGGYNNIE